jgi:uncharacterized protein (TIGR02145 family)
MYKLLLTTAAVAAAIGLAVAGEPSFGTFTDTRDGQTYKTVKLPDGKTWMAENLNYLPKTGKSWCYKDNAKNCKQYGRLYDWKTAKTVCPAGWKLPDAADWNMLLTAAGGNAAGKKLKAKSGWNLFGNGTDDFGFSALSGGYRAPDGSFDNTGNYGFWWMATDNMNGTVSSQRMDYDKHNAPETIVTKEFGLSVRCVAEVIGLAAAAEPEYGTVNDKRDGQTYRTVKIGGRIWMAQNLNYLTKKGSWCYNNSADSCVKYGKLYDWKTALMICPAGYHLPSRVEWDSLAQTAGGVKQRNDYATTVWENASTKLKAKSGWSENANGTDDFGFSALPGGFRNDGKFGEVGYNGSWWTPAEYDDLAYSRIMDPRYGGHVIEVFDSKSSGLSVRCVADNP